MSFIDAIILGIVEGITEFLPISSTGHLILTREALGLEGEQVDRQLIIIQGAAILAVVWEFRRKLFGTLFSLHNDVVARRFALNLVVASIPLAVLGLLFKDQIESVLFKPVPVALALVIGPSTFVLVVAAYVSGAIDAVRVLRNASREQIDP